MTRSSLIPVVASVALIVVASCAVALPKTEPAPRFTTTTGEKFSNESYTS